MYRYGRDSGGALLRLDTSRTTLAEIWLPHFRDGVWARADNSEQTWTESTPLSPEKAREEFPDVDLTAKGVLYTPSQLAEEATPAG